VRIKDFTNWLDSAGKKSGRDGLEEPAAKCHREMIEFSRFIVLSKVPYDERAGNGAGDLKFSTIFL